MKKTLLIFMTALLVLTGCSNNNIMSSYKGFDKKDHHFVAPGTETMLTSLENKEPGIYYVGYAECPWCIALVPILEEIATEQDVQIQYLNTRDKTFQDDAKAIERYTAFDNALPESDRSGGSVPFVIVIGKDGSIQTHKGTAPTHDAGSGKEITDAEVLYVKTRVGEMFKAVSE